jgi:hypothetical protein
VVRAYSKEPAGPGPLFMRARELRDRAFVLLEGQHRPSYARDLYAVAGWSLTFLAWLSLDFDRPGAAEDHARAAWLYAERAEHDGLRAWVRASQTAAAFWQDDFNRAAQYTADGLRNATGTAALLLASAHATNLAHADQDEQAWEALRRAQQFAETADASSDELGGLFTCSVDRASGFWSETHLQLGAADLALEQADQGVRHSRRNRWNSATSAVNDSCDSNKYVPTWRSASSTAQKARLRLYWILPPSGVCAISWVV